MEDLIFSFFLSFFSRSTLALSSFILLATSVFSNSEYVLSSKFVHPIKHSSFRTRELFFFIIFRDVQSAKHSGANFILGL